MFPRNTKPVKRVNGGTSAGNTAALAAPRSTTAPDKKINQNRTQNKALQDGKNEVPAKTSRDHRLKAENKIFDGTQHKQKNTGDRHGPDWQNTPQLEQHAKNRERKAG